MKRFLSHYILLMMSLAAWFLGVSKVFANAFFEQESGAGLSAIKQDTLGANIIAIINYFLGILGVVAVGFIIYGGILMVASAGAEEGVTKAKKIVTYAAIGFVLIAISYSIVTFVTNIFNT